MSEKEKQGSQGASSPSVNAPAKGAAAGCDESVRAKPRRYFCEPCGDEHSDRFYPCKAIDAEERDRRRLAYLATLSSEDPLRVRLASESEIEKLRAEVARLTTERNVARRLLDQRAGWVEAKEADLNRLIGDVERLTRWQEEVAEGLGYLNRPEGQSGYEVAEPAVIVAAWREREANAEQLREGLTCHVCSEVVDPEQAYVECAACFTPPPEAP